MDTLTPSQRSELMGRVRSKDTKPELAVRKLVHSLGYRFRLHRADLPGKPDLVFPGRLKVIFIHGCFWHRHGGRCRGARLPKSNVDFWLPKLEKNRKRDIKNRRLLRALGWDSLVLWECQLNDNESLVERIKSFLESTQQPDRC